MVELLLERGATVTLDLTEDGAVKGVAELQEALKHNNHALALKLLPHLFVESSSEALYQTVVVINHAYCLSRQMLSNDTHYAERLHTTSDEAQLVGAALLDTLSDGDHGLESRSHPNASAETTRATTHHHLHPHYILHRMMMQQTSSNIQRITS